MFTVYALYSSMYDKIYIGFTSNMQNRMALHNSIANKGFTIKYRPWELVYSEEYPTKKEAMQREKQLKAAKGREFIRGRIPKRK